MDFSFFIESVLILALALVFDLIFGEPPDRFHPTVWLGKTIDILKPRFRNTEPSKEKINGILLCIVAASLFAIPVFLISFLVRFFFGPIPYVIVSAILLKFTFALKGMRYYTLPIAQALEQNDIEGAKSWLPFIVRRDPKELNERLAISAAVESIAESTTDSVTSPLFFFGLFGLPGAVVFRVMNTLDSMVGYRDAANINLGWFSAKTDTALNYVPSRLTGALMVLASLLLGKNWRKSWNVMMRDKKNMQSKNAGWTIGAMAGALDTQLEKLGVYKLGDGGELKPVHIREALRIMLLTAALFSIAVVFPLLLAEALFVGIAWF